MQSSEASFSEIILLIQTDGNRAFQVANKELISLYWQIGQAISQQVKSENWGQSVVKELAKYIRTIDLIR